jgi:hypothetical protein
MDQIFINQETEVETVYDWDGECSMTTEEIYEKSTMGKAIIFRDTGDFEHEETTSYALWHSDASSAEFRSPVFISDNGEASVKIVRVTAPNAVNREEKVISVTAESIKEVLGYTPADEENAKQMVVTFAYDANGSLTCTPGVAEVFAAHRAGRTVVAVFENSRLAVSSAASSVLDFTAEDWLKAEYKMIRLFESGSMFYYTGKIPIQASVARISEITLLAESWVEKRDNLYAQTVEIEGATENSQVDITPSVEQLVIFYEKDLGFVTENDGGEVTVYAIGQKPENDYTIQVTITEVIT